MSKAKFNPEVYSKDTGCPFCGSKYFTRLKPQYAASEVVCDECRAIFYNLEENNKDKAGHFTGRYAPHTKSTILKHPFSKEGK